MTLYTTISPTCAPPKPRPRMQKPDPLVHKKPAFNPPPAAAPVVNGVPEKEKEKVPSVITSSWILKKYRGMPASVVLHLHQLNFRFEGQDGSFGYQSPMKMLLEGVRTETIPPGVGEEFREAGTRFYDGMCGVGDRCVRRLTQNRPLDCADTRPPRTYYLIGEVGGE